MGEYALFIISISKFIASTKMSKRSDQQQQLQQENYKYIKIIFH